MRCAGRLGCGLLLVLNVVDVVLGVTLLLLGTFTPAAVSQLNSMLANGDDGSGHGRVDEEADRDFIEDRFWLAPAALSLLPTGLVPRTLSHRVPRAGLSRCRS